jgi:hypothetical protein
VHSDVLPLHDLHYESDGQLRAVAQACEIVLSVILGMSHACQEALFVRIGHYEEGQVNLLLHCFMSQLDMRLPARHPTKPPHSSACLDCATTQRHALKMRQLNAELARNPFYIVQCMFLMARKQVLVDVLTALDSNYVFFIALQAIDNVLPARVERLVDAELRQRSNKHDQEKVELFAMNEKQCSTLLEPRRVTIDKRRTQIHTCLPKIGIEPIAEADEGRQHHRHTSCNCLCVKCMHSEDRPKSVSKEKLKQKKATVANPIDCAVVSLM